MNRLVRPDDRIVQLACRVHPGERWTLASLIPRDRTCGRIMGYDHHDDPVVCSRPVEVVAESTAGERVIPPPVLTRVPELDDFVDLVHQMADAGVIVATQDGRLVLRHRRDRAVSPALVAQARCHGLLLLWTAISASQMIRWHACDACGMPQLVTRPRRCHMTPGCPGTLHALPKVTEKKRRRAGQKEGTPAP